MTGFYRGLMFVLLALPALVRAEVQVVEYTLEPGDVIRVNVAEHPEFSGQHKIRPDGRINFPVVGEVDVASLTCAQLVKLMQGKLSAYINNPVVSVSIEAYYANKIYVIGGVRKPGDYNIFEPIDVMKALAMCGGLTRAKVRRLKIIRGDGTVETIRMKEFWGDETRRNNERWVLYPGDTLFAPASFQMPWAMIATILGIVNLTLVIILNSDRVSGL
jgi:polysaccharide export outer membrane protein